MLLEGQGFILVIKLLLSLFVVSLTATVGNAGKHRASVITKLEEDFVEDFLHTESRREGTENTEEISVAPRVSLLPFVPNKIQHKDWLIKTVASKVMIVISER